MVLAAAVTVAVAVATGTRTTKMTTTTFKATKMATAGAVALNDVEDSNRKRNR